jgi:hypothetical protein
MKTILSYCTLAVVLAGCASAPTGPRVAVMPTPGKPFELFMQEEQICRNYAAQSVGQSRNDAAAQNFIGAAAVGTVIGAAADVLSNGGHGGGSGAGAGLVMGSMVGAGESANASHDAQQRYDIAYEQCMYAKGNQVPGYVTPRTTYFPPPAPPASVPADTGAASSHPPSAP